MTPEREKELLNELAAELYEAIGYNATEGFDFTQSRHPQELAQYRLAEIALNFFRDREMMQEEFY